MRPTCPSLFGHVSDWLDFHRRRNSHGDFWQSHQLLKNANGSFRSILSIISWLPYLLWLDKQRGAGDPVVPADSLSDGAEGGCPQVAPAARTCLDWRADVQPVSGAGTQTQLQLTIIQPEQSHQSPPVISSTTSKPIGYPSIPCPIIFQQFQLNYMFFSSQIFYRYKLILLLTTISMQCV